MMESRHGLQPLSFDQKYFLALMVIAYSGFGINALVNPASLPIITVFHKVHILFMVSWFPFLNIQAYLNSKYQNTKKPLFSGVMLFLVLGIVATVFLVSRIILMRDPAKTIDVTYNLFSLLIFLLLIIYAFKFRAHPKVYFRSLLMGSLVLILPALKRMMRIFSFNEMIAFPILLVLFLIVVYQDFKTQKKIHFITMLSLGLMILNLIVLMVVKLI